MAACAGSFVYAYSADGKAWSTSSMNGPIGHELSGAKLAVAGDVVYLAYSTFDPLGGCVGGGPDGVYYRSRVLPAGAWSDPVLLGPPGDQLLQLAASGTTLHAVVAGAGVGPSTAGEFYERLSSSGMERVSIDPILYRPSLAVGSDGLARIAGMGIDRLWLLNEAGGGFENAVIPGTGVYDVLPQLVLDSADHPQLMWTHNRPMGCGDGFVTPDDGTWHGTGATGTWVAERVSHDQGDTSLAIDPASDRLDALIRGPDGVGYYSRMPGDAWNGPVRLPIGDLIRVGATQSLLVVDADNRYGTGVSVMLKPGNP